MAQRFSFLSAAAFSSAASASTASSFRTRRISAVLSEADLAGSYPEDMMNLMRRAAGLIDHMGSNHKDLHNRRALELTEAKIRRLAKYYIGEGRLDADWRYKRDQLRLMVE